MKPQEALRLIEQLHPPDYPPEGHTWLSGSAEPICGGCATGDPFLDPYWPCETMKIINQVDEEL